MFVTCERDVTKTRFCATLERMGPRPFRAIAWAAGLLPLLLLGAQAPDAATTGAQRHAVAGRAVVRTLAHDRRARVIVALRDPGPGRTLASTTASVAAVQRAVLHRVDKSQFQLSAHWRTIPGFAGSVTRRGLAELLASPQVRRVDLDGRVHASLAQSVPLIRADQVQAQGVTGKGVTVAVV